MKTETFRCLSCDHQFKHIPGNGPPIGCPRCGHKYLHWVSWFAVHTQPKMEGAVRDALNRMGYETLYLHYRRTVKHARKVKEVLRPYFPRYVFVGVAPGQGFYDINTCPGASTVVYSGDKPLEIPESDITLLRQEANEHGLVGGDPDAVPERERMKPGEVVNITYGPMTGLSGVVELDKGGEVALLIEMFKQRVRAHFKPEALSPAVRSY